MGQGLRFIQEYFLVACSLSDLVRRFCRFNSDLATLPDKAAIQLNDTHPAMAVPELMRILLDEKGLGWDEAWDITQRTLSYTNHTLLPEALENWPVAWFELMLPRHLEIIYEINRRLMDAVRLRFPGDEGRMARISLIDETGERKVRMANLAIVGSHSTNGVAAIHSDLLRRVTVSDLAAMYPERFNNKTNGVTPRRWLLMANPPLAGSITQAIGDGWTTDLEQLRGLTPLADDPSFKASVGQAKREAKARFADWLKTASGQTVDPDTIFDCQIKRIHEYKRQLLNALRIIVLYNRIRTNPELRHCAAHLPLRRQGGAGLSARQADHQIHQQPCRDDRRRSGDGRAAQGRLPAGILRVPGGAADSRQRRLQSDLDRRLRGQRHLQHEVHDERGADPGHARRGHHRDGRGSRARRISSSSA